MRTLLVFILIAARMFGADAWTDYRTANYGDALTDTVLNSSRIGDGSWVRSQGGTYTMWQVVSNASLTFRSACSVGGTNFSSTGTKWLHYDIPGGSYATNALGYESAGFIVPGGSGAGFRFMRGRCFVRCAVTNATGRANNFDLLLTDGNPFGIIQLQTGLGDFRFIAHAGGGNGGPINISPDLFYELDFWRDDAAGTWTVRAYDTDGALLDTAIGTMSNTGGSAFWLRIQAGYAGLGDATGWFEVSPIWIEWSSTPAPPSDPGSSIGYGLVGNVGSILSP